MQRRPALIVRALILLAAAVVLVNAADAPYFGTWRLNPAKSDFGPVTVTYAQTNDGWTATEDGKSYTFKMDGKSYPTADPRVTEVWKQQNPTTWEVRTAIEGKATFVDVYTLSADGKTLTDTGKAVEKEQAGNGSAVFHRAGGGTGLAGTWNGKVKQDPFTLVIEPHESDGLIFRVPTGFEVKAHFDGKPYPMTGRLSAKSTAAFTKTGPRSFETRQVTPDRPLFTATVSVSADGKTLTENAKIGDGKRVWVFDRQP